MKPFRATFTPRTNRNPETREWEPNMDESRTVLIVAILSQGPEEWESAVFIDSDGRLNSTYINNITQCQAEEVNQ